MRRAGPMIGCVLAWLAGASMAGAQSLEVIFRGKTLEISVGTGPGGGYDANARLVSRHLGRFIPGSPKVVVSNVPGGGGITAANKLFNVAPRDGLAIGTFSNAMLTLPLLGGESARFDPAAFTWVGSVAQEDGVCITSLASGVASWVDLRARDVIVGTTAPGTTTHLYPTLLRNLFGAKFKIVSGYPDGSSIVLAFERGEVQGICQTYSSLKVLHPDWIPARKVNVIATIGLARNKELPDVPALTEIARTDDERRMVKIILAPTGAGRPFAAPPGIAEDRAGALREGFARMVKDPEFLADATQGRIDVQAMPGAEIVDLLRDIYASDPRLVARLRGIISADGAR